MISRPLAPYEEAAAGIAATLASDPQQILVDSYVLGDPAGGAESIAAAIRSSDARLVFAVGTEAFRALRGPLADLPIVIAMAYDPVREFQLDPNGPGNVYGACLQVPLSRRIAVFREFLPEVKSIAVIIRQAEDPFLWSEVEQVAAKTGLRVVPIPLTDLRDLEACLSQARQSAEAFMMTLDKEIYTPATTRKILLYFARSQMPVYAFSPNFVEAGALLSVSAPYRENGASAAALGLQILRGRPVAQRFVPTEAVQIAWNDHVARALGIRLLDHARDRCQLLY